MVGTRPSYCWGLGLIPGRETKTPQAGTAPPTHTPEAAGRGWVQLWWGEKVPHQTVPAQGRHFNGGMWLR